MELACPPLLIYLQEEAFWNLEAGTCSSVIYSLSSRQAAAILETGTCDLVSLLISFLEKLFDDRMNVMDHQHGIVQVVAGSSETGNSEVACRHHFSALPPTRLPQRCDICSGNHAASHMLSDARRHDSSRLPHLQRLPTAPEG